MITQLERTDHSTSINCIIHFNRNLRGYCRNCIPLLAWIESPCGAYFPIHLHFQTLLPGLLDCVCQPYAMIFTFYHELLSLWPPLQHFQTRLFWSTTGGHILCMNPSLHLKNHMMSVHCWPTMFTRFKSQTPSVPWSLITIHPKPTWPEPAGRVFMPKPMGLKGSLSRLQPQY